MKEGRLLDRDDALRQLHEGAAATIARLAAASGLTPEHLSRLAGRNGWRPVEEGAALKARLAVLARRIVDLLDEPDEDILLSKQRLDAISALLRAVDRLKDVIDAADPERQAGENSEAAIRQTFASIDNRIEQLAHAYAEKLVAKQSDQGGSGGGTS
jgi:hypothetical protein